MGRLPFRAAVPLLTLAIAAAACSSSSTPSPSSSSSESSGAPIPSAKTISVPVTYGYYDAHIDAMLSTDISSKALATAQHINYSAALLTKAPSTFPSLYLIKGAAAPNQPNVFGSQPGESDYSPLWQEVTVQWKPGVTPKLLTSDNQINALVASGKLTKTPTPVVLNCPIVQVTSSKTAPSATTISMPVTYGYYDSHVDVMLSTDVSTKAQATALHVNYSGALLTRPANAFPSLYQIKGAAAPNQPVVFGSQPGETDYSPLWQEVTVQWKAGVTPTLLTSDNQIKSLATAGKLTMTPTPVVLNCPIVKVLGSSS
jgi:hypothetical protein